MTVIFSDTFTDTDGTDLQSHTPTVGTSYTRSGGTGGISITSNAATLDNTSATFATNRQYALAMGTTPIADGSIVCDVQFGLFNGQGRLGFEVRRQGDTSHYEWRLIHNAVASTDSIELFHFDSSSNETSIAAANLTVPARSTLYALSLSHTGNAFVAVFNGSTVINTTDSTISAAGSYRLTAGANNVDQIGFDNLVIENASAGPTVARSVFPFFLD